MWLVNLTKVNNVVGVLLNTLYVVRRTYDSIIMELLYQVIVK